MDILKNTDRENILNKLQLTITLILILFLSVTGATYAYLYATATDVGTITGNMATVNFDLNVERVFPLDSSENTGVMVPQLSTSGSNSSPLGSALKSGCIDGNGNVVCQVYKITVRNNGGTATLVVDGTVSFYGNVELTTDISSVMPSLSWKLIDSVDSEVPSNSVLGVNQDIMADIGGEDNIFANDVVLATNDVEDYYMIIWINETGLDQPVDVGKSFYSSIRFDASNGTGVTATFSSYSSSS